MPLMKNLLGRKDLAARRNRRALALEPLEGRALLSVTGVDITKITAPGDNDGNQTDEHVTVPAGTAVTVDFNYTTCEPTAHR